MPPSANVARVECKYHGWCCLMTADDLKQGLVDTLLRAADKLGVPCVILAVLLYFGREVAMAIHHSVLEPMVKSHVEFLESTSETLHEIGKTQDRQAETLQEIAAGQRRLEEAIPVRAKEHAETRN